MNAEPDHEEVREDDNEPSTKGFVRSELRSVETNLLTEIEGVDQRLINVEEDVAIIKDDVGTLKDDMMETKQDVRSLKDDMSRVVKIVESIDKNTRGIPAKVKRLYEKVFPHG